MEFFAANIQLREVFVQLLAFIIVFWTLKKLAWKPILQSLEDRRTHIKEELDAIERGKKDIEELRQKYESATAKIEEEASQKLQEALSDGKRIAREIQDEARTETRAVLDKAKEDLQIEIDKAMLTLRDEIANLTIAATERLLDEKMDAKKDKEIVLRFVERLEKSK